MSFRAQLVNDTVQVEPGSSVAVALEVTSEAEVQDHIELTVEGLDSEWIAVPVPSFLLDPGQIRTERFFLKPARESHSSAGNYPFVVKIRSLETGDTKTLQGVLEIKQFNHISVDIQPRKAIVSPTSRDTNFQVTVMNLGNSDQTLQLFASDVDDLFAYEFASEQVSLQPGQQKAVLLTATATKSSILATARLQAATVTVRSVVNPAVSASGQAQIEQRALVSPSAVALILLLASALFFYFSMIPKPPIVESFQADKMKVMVGQPITFHWKADNASSVTLQIGDKKITGLTRESTYTYFVEENDDGLPVTLWAIHNSQKSREETLTLHVDKPIQAPLATIDKFELRPKSVRLGSIIQVTYKLGDGAVDATLSPTGTRLDPRGEGVQVRADIAGEFEYKIIATNKDGKKVESKVIRVSVTQASKADIVKFDSDLHEVDAGVAILLSWQVVNAARLELKVGSKEPVALAQMAGTQEVAIDSETTFKLIAYDSDGLRTERKFSVKVKQAAPPDPAKSSEPPTLGGTPPPLTTTAGGPGATGGKNR